MKLNAAQLRNVEKQLGFSPGRGERWQQHSDEQGDDRHDDEQLDERKPSFA